MITDYLSAGPLIAQRLRVEVPELEAIYKAADLNDIPESQQKFPCAHVLYHEDRVQISEGGRSSARETQDVIQAWYVVVAVRNVKDQLTGDSARKEVGPILVKVLKALQGWQPSNEHSPMARANGTRVGYKAGFLYFPLLFTTRITI